MDVDWRAWVRAQLRSLGYRLDELADRIDHLERDEHGDS